MWFRYEWRAQWTSPAFALCWDWVRLAGVLMSASTRVSAAAGFAALDRARESAHG